MIVKEYNRQFQLMSSCQLALAQYAEQVALYSGRSIFFKGNYQACVDNHPLKYALVELGQGEADSGMYVGVCMPRACNDTAIEQSVNGILRRLNSTFDIYSINSHIQDYQVDMDWFSYLTIVIMAAFALAVLWASLRNLKEKKSPHRLLDAFDLGSNMSHFKIRQNEDLNIFDGVRAIAMMWVVIGHVFSFYLGSGLENISNIMPVISKPFYLLIQAGILSVDVFFMLGGFFLAFVFLRENNKSLAAVGFAVLQRALRIWPAYIVAMFFYDSLFLQMGSGVFWNHAEPDTKMCSSMWREILFVANLVDNGNEQCLGWGWYLQVDFQLFLACLALLFIYYRSKMASFLLALLLSIGSTIFVIVYTYRHKIKLFTDLSAFSDFGEFMPDVYMKPYGRCTPYFMGLVLGILFVEYRKAKKEHTEQDTLLGKVELLCRNNKIRVAIEWLGIGIMSFITFIPRCLQEGCTWSQMSSSFYWGLSKPGFILGLMLTLLPTILGHRHSFFNLVLTSKAFHFIARISFCTYLVHLMVLYQYTLTRNYNIYFNITEAFVAYLGMLVVSLFLGFWLTVLVELPCAKLQRELMQFVKGKRAPPKEKALSEQLLGPEEMKNSLSTSISKSIMTQD